jgi:patatin-like phospholipase/acyl hydrolase
MKLLSLNGGGTRGIMSSIILSRLEQELGKKSHEIFDLVSGLSTGSVLAALIGAGIPADQITKFYRERCPEIFKNPKCTLLNLIFPKYNKNNLRNVLNEQLNIPFSEMKTKVMIYACRIDKPNAQVRFFKSWKDRDFKLNTADIVQASGSAPTYFSPMKLDGGVYVDGALYCNNPSLCAIIEATKLGSSLHDIYNVNIELDDWSGVSNANKIDSMIDWALNLWDITSSLGQQANENISKNLLGTRHQHIVSSSSCAIDSLDFDSMEKIANAAWEEHKGALIDWLGEV